MRNLIWSAVACVLASAPAGATTMPVLGPAAAVCQRGGPAMLVEVNGFKARRGLVRVQSYGGDPSAWFNKGTYLTRIEVPVPADGPVAICLPVPHAGTYAVSVRHDLNGSGSADRSDGGGVSGNPRVSLFDVMLHRKPDPARVAVAVRGVTVVPVLLNYVQGMSLGPIARGGG